MTIAASTIQLHASDAQQEIIRCTARRIHLFAGRRWGKTVGVARNRLLDRCLSNPGHRYIFAAPSYSQAVVEFDSIRTHPALADYIMEARSQPVPSIRFFNNSTAAFRSLDRAHLLRGLGAHEIWIDEIQDVNKDDYFSVLAPIVAASRGTIGTGGQFRGMEDWRYKSLYVPGQVKGQTKIRSWRFPTESGIRFQGEEGRQELALYEATMPKVEFDQEFRCIPTANKNALFTEEDIQACACDDAGRVDGRVTYVIGLDIGRKPDPGAYVVLDCDNKRIQESKAFPIGQRHEVSLREMIRVQTKFGGATVLIDSTGGGGGGKTSTYDQFARMYRDGLKDSREVFWTHANKSRMVQGLCLAIEKHQVLIPKINQELIEQLSSYEFEYVGGSWKYGAKKGYHDDLVAALMMAWEACTRGWNLSNEPSASLGAVL